LFLQKIKNPAYKGKWKTPLIANPEFKDDPDLYVFGPLKYFGIELWQVKAGSIFDNILITDDPDYAKAVAEETWQKNKDVRSSSYFFGIPSSIFGSCSWPQVPLSWIP
jgi:calreticulin